MSTHEHNLKNVNLDTVYVDINRGLNELQSLERLWGKFFLIDKVKSEEKFSGVECIRCYKLYEDYGTICPDPNDKELSKFFEDKFELWYDISIQSCTKYMIHQKYTKDEKYWCYVQNDHCR